LTKWRWGRFSPSTSVSPAKLYSTKFSIIIITRGRYNMPFSGRHDEWTQFGLHPPLCELKKNKNFSRCLPTAAARVRTQIRSRGICGGQSGNGASFLRVLRFPLPILIPPTAPHSSSSIIRGWYNRPVSGRRTNWTQFHPTPGN
jgi:hypothetical protein